VRFEEIPHTLIEKARQSHPDALEEFCLMVQPDAYAVLLSLLRNHDDASDALQEALIRIIRFLPKLRDVKSFPGWIMRLLVNQAANSHKSRSAPVVDIESLGDDAHASVQSITSTPLSPRRSAENHEMRERINHTILSLTERQKTALVLFEMEGLTIHEVAEAMEVTDGAVKFHLHEARKNMKRALVSAGIPDASMLEESPS